ncbi:MAG: hypothetical protein PHC53_02585 [Patescibacteria group bacterium]|nr:hypothetical protein [Patescibacteria group bacterium]
MARKQKTKPKKLKRSNPKRERLVKLLLENRGISVSAAMKEVGYSDAYAKNPQQITSTDSWDELMKKHLPDEKLAKAHEALLTSKHVERLVVHAGTPDEDLADMLKEANCTLKKIYIFMGEKHVLFWAPNDKAREAAVDMGYKLKGRYTSRIKIERSLSDLTDEELDQLLDEEAKKIAK